VGASIEERFGKEGNTRGGETDRGVEITQAVFTDSRTGIIDVINRLVGARYCSHLFGILSQNIGTYCLYPMKKSN